MNPDTLRTLGVPPNAWKVDAKIAIARHANYLAQLGKPPRFAQY